MSAIVNGDGGVYATACGKNATTGQQPVSLFEDFNNSWRDPISQMSSHLFLPENLKFSLLSIEELEAELNGIHQEESGNE